MVNLKNPNKSLKNLVHPPGFQNSSQCVGKSSESSNLLYRASFRASKQVYSRGRSQTCCIARHFSRSVSASFASKNISSEAIALSFLGESEEKDMSLDLKTPTALRMTTGRLFSRKIPSLKLPATFTSILEGTAYIISQDDQVSAKKNRNLVSGGENALQSAQRL